MSGSDKLEIARDLKHLTACRHLSPEVALALLCRPRTMPKNAVTHVPITKTDAFALDLTQIVFDGRGQRMSRAALRLRRAAHV